VAQEDRIYVDGQGELFFFIDPFILGPSCYSVDEIKYTSKLPIDEDMPNYIRFDDTLN